MYLTETHIINKNHHLWGECDGICFKSKNLYNKANYIVRQKFIETSKLKEQNLIENRIYLNYYIIKKELINTKDFDYYELPAKVSNMTLQNLDKNWRGFFASIKSWSKNKSKFKGKPNLPNYLDKKKGRYVTEYELGAISKKSLKDGIIKLSKTNIEIPFINKNEELKMVRIVPCSNKIYKIEIVYDKKIICNDNLDKERVLCADLGVDNLLTLTSNIKGFQPLIINGRIIKSINQYYNKKISECKSELPFSYINGKRVQLSNSERISNITHKRNMKLNHELHHIGKYILDICLKNNIGRFVIGVNKGIKDSINIGRVNNQNFVNIPTLKIRNIIKYKLELNGIEYIEQEESYTSKASFLDMDEIPVYNDKVKCEYEFSGKRISRGLYRSNVSGKAINADVNGSYNIMRKVFPDIFIEGIEGLSVNPTRIKSVKKKRI